MQSAAETATSAAFNAAVEAMAPLTSNELEKLRGLAGVRRMAMYEEERKANSDRINERIKELVAAADVDLRELVISTGIGAGNILIRGEVLEIMMAPQGFTIRPLGVDMFQHRSVCQLTYPDGEFGSSTINVDPMNPDFEPYLPYIRLGQYLWREGIPEMIPSRNTVVAMGMYPGEAATFAASSADAE